MVYLLLGGEDALLGGEGVLLGGGDGELLGGGHLLSKKKRMKGSSRFRVRSVNVLTSEDKEDKDQKETRFDHPNRGR